MSRLAMVVGTARFLPSFRGAFLSAVAAAGHEVHVFAPPDAPAQDWLAARGMHFHEIALSRASLRPLEDARFVPALARRLRDVRADVLLAYHIKPVVFAVPAARLAGIPRRYAMITGLGFAFTEAAGTRRKLVNAAARSLYAMSLRMVDGVVFQNEDDREAFARLGLTGRTPVHIVRSGVELDRYAATDLPAAPHFLMIARLLRDKGVGEYVTAARIVRARRPAARFTLIGAADPNPSAFPVAEIERAVAEGVIAHHPFVEDVRPEIAAASAFVLPSYREGTSRAALEALAMGRPVITTDAPGCRDTVIDGESGLLVPVGDAGALARAMERLADAPDEAARMGRRGRALAEVRFDARSSAARLMEVLGL